MTPFAHLGPQLLAARIKSGVSRAAIARLLDISATQVDLIEKGENGMGARTPGELVDWAAMVGCEVGIMIEETK